ncbi:helix-turn-helix domain-containing protein [Paenibacillus cymbidii]|uniref:helix-turn-helix domain-containing protein n=1 Tax=Paenibacillus cymbidii TaxID=1639034 RepID=UPI0010814D05|nr:helix-turn-helix domain-containing protein [Paenibacillus cymbidii]
MLHKMRSYARHKRFLMRLVIFMLLLCLVPIAILGVFFYHNVQKSMRKDIEQANERYLLQTVNAMELVVKQLGNGYRQFVTNSTFVEFDRFPLGNYFEEIDTWYIASNREELTNYITSKAKVQKNIETLMQLSDFIFSIYYVNPARGIVLTSGSLQYEIGRFYDSGWDAQLQPTALGYPIMMNVRNAKQEDGSVKRVVPVVFRPLDAKYTVVINLDADAFYTNLISRLESKDKSSLYVFSRNGEPLLYDSDAGKAGDLSLVQSVVGGPNVGFDGGTKSNQVLSGRELISWRSSGVLGWKIASVTSLHDMYSNISSIRNLFFTISVLLAIAAAILAVLTSSRMYRPVSMLLQFVKEGSWRDPGGKPAQGEFHVIREGLADAYETKRNLQIRLRESLPAHQEKFVRSLLKTNAFDEKYIEERFGFLGIGLPTRGLVPLLVSAEGSDGAAASIESEKIERLLVTDTIAGALDPILAHWVLELDDQLYLALVHCGEMEMAVVFEAAESIRDLLAERHNLACTIGIGTYCGTIADLPGAFREAEETLQFRGMSSGSDIIYIEDVRLHAHKPLHYPKEKEAALLVCLKNGDKDKALDVFAEMVRDLRAQTGKIAFPQVQQTFLLLLVKLIETVRDLQLDMEQIVPGERPNAVAAFLQKEGWREMTIWFEGLIGTMATYIGQAFLEKKNAHVENAKQLIDTENINTLSLTFVADKLNLNPAYLSRIFKEYTGVTFTDYVTRARVLRSKELLLHTELKVQDISEQLGYAKVTHFIKLFKEMNGITPGEYRKQHI